jgi:hypothetical protein
VPEADHARIHPERQKPRLCKGRGIASSEDEREKQGKKNRPAAQPLRKLEDKDFQLQHAACLLACLLAKHDVRVIWFVKLFYIFSNIHPKHPTRERRDSRSSGMRGSQKGVKHGERLFSVCDEV